MKTLIATLTLVLTSSLFAQEVSFRSAEWDNLAIPLQITPFYLQIESSSQVTEVLLEMDMYIKGEFIRTISSGGLQWKEKPAPLKVNSAIYFKQTDGEKLEGTVVIEWNGSKGISKFEVSENELPIRKGSGSEIIEGQIQSPARTPIFRIIAGEGGVTFPADPTDTAKSNPNSTVLIGYIKTE
jgi:hypothetical protein